MSARELVVLGTAAQVPTRTRAHPGAVLLWDDETVLFDPGEGTQRQLTLADIPASRITRICLTHLHGDHCLGLPGVLQRMGLDGAGSVDLYYPAAGQQYVDRLRHASASVFELDVHEHPVERDGLVDTWPALELHAAALHHRVDAYGWRLQEPDDDRPGQSFAYVMDTGPCDGAATVARGVDLLVCESTYLKTEAELAAHYLHLTATDAAELAASAGARSLVLMHYSQRHPDEDAFAAEAAETFTPVQAARDLDRIPVPPRR